MYAQYDLNAVKETVCINEDSIQRIIVMLDFLGTVYTVVDLYLHNNEYDGVFRWGTVMDTSVNGGNIE